MLLSINLDKSDEVEKSAQRVIDKLESRKKDYEGIVKDISNVPTKRNYLSNSTTYLKKKNSILQNKADKLRDFKSAVKTFTANTKAADKRVAEHVKESSDAFYSAHNIKTGAAQKWDAFWSGAGKVAKAAWEGIKKFYEDHKFIIDFLVDIVLVVAAVVALIAAIPTGGASLLAVLGFAAAIFGTASAVADLFSDSIALGYHLGGDDESAGKWADRGLRDAFTLVGKGFDKVVEAFTGIKTDFFENAFGMAHDVMAITAAAITVAQMGAKVLKSFNIKDFKDFKNLFKPGGLKEWRTGLGKNGIVSGFKRLVGISGTSDFKGKKWGDVVANFKKFNINLSQKEAFHLLNAVRIIKTVKTDVKIVNAVFEGDLNKTYWENKNPIGKSVKDIIKAGENIGGSFKEGVLVW